MHSEVSSKFAHGRAGYVLQTSAPLTDQCLFDVTAGALQEIEPFASNYEITAALHRSLQNWASSSEIDGRWTRQHLARSYRQCSLMGFMGRYEDVRHGFAAHLLPIGIHFSRDPGRAFELAASAANFVEIDGQFCLGTGLLSMLAAHLCEGMSPLQAVPEVIEFALCLDWGDDLTGALRYALRTRDQEVLEAPHAPRGLDMVFQSARAVLRATSLETVVEERRAEARPVEETRVIGVLTSLSIANG